MKLDEYNEAELHLSYISRLPMDNRRKFYYFLLLGCLYSHRQQHEEAMREFHNALETGYNTSSPLMMTVMELQALSQPMMQLILLQKLIDVRIAYLNYASFTFLVLLTCVWVIIYL